MSPPRTPPGARQILVAYAAEVNRWEKYREELIALRAILSDEDSYDEIEHLVGIGVIHDAINSINVLINRVSSQAAFTALEVSAFAKAIGQMDLIRPQSNRQAVLH